MGYEPNPNNSIWLLDLKYCVVNQANKGDYATKFEISMIKELNQKSDFSYLQHIGYLKLYVFCKWWTPHLGLCSKSSSVSIIFWVPFVH